MAVRTKGKCKYCGKAYTFSYMKKHLGTCAERQKRRLTGEGKKKCGYFELAVYSAYNRDYWLFLYIKETATLKDLDIFLRDIWLECCGHLSSFKINGTLYDVAPSEDFFWGPPAENMNHRLSTVLEPGMTFDYDYDFGSTTSLMITVTDHQIDTFTREKITILSRNEPPELVCSECEAAPAEWVCGQCIWDDCGLLCKKCAKTHDCGEDMLLKVCNSPRMGVCAYEGSEVYPDRFTPDTELVKGKKK